MLLGADPPSVNASDRLPTPCPPVTATRLDCRAPSPILHRSADADVQTVASVALPPTRPHSSLYADCPPSRPKTVTLKAPLAAPLLLTVLLARTVSTYENRSVTLPAATPEVSDSCRVHAVCAVCMPETDLQRTELSDVHTVVTPRLLPTRIRPLKSASPTLAPSRVALVAPVLAQFDTSTLLGAGPMHVKTSDTLPTLAKDPGATTCRPRSPPVAILLRIELADVQTVLSDWLPASRTRKL